MIEQPLEVAVLGRLHLETPHVSFLRAYARGYPACALSHVAEAYLYEHAVVMQRHLLSAQQFDRHAAGL
jgi:hypothetical protein